MPPRYVRPWLKWFFDEAALRLRTGGELGVGLVRRDLRFG